MYDSLFHCRFLYGFLDLANVCVMSGGTEIGLRITPWCARYADGLLRGYAADLKLKPAMRRRTIVLYNVGLPDDVAESQTTPAPAPEPAPVSAAPAPAPAALASASAGAASAGEPGPEPEPEPLSGAHQHDAAEIKSGENLVYEECQRQLQQLVRDRFGAECSGAADSCADRRGKKERTAALAKEKPAPTAPR